MRLQAFKVKAAFFLAIFASLFLFSSCVEDEQFIALRSNVEVLSRRVSSLERDVSSLREELRDLRGTSTVKLDILSKDVEDLKGALQEESSKTDDQYYSLLKRIEAIEASISQLKKQIAYIKGARESFEVSKETVPIPGTIPPKVPSQAPSKESPEALYSRALNLYRNGNIDDARDLFEKFILLYPDSDLSDNALFWLGETYYVEGKYPEAIVRYQEVLSKYPKGDKVPSALLKLAFSQERMGDVTDAKVTLEKLVSAFPGTPQARIAKKELEKLKKAQKGSE